MGIYEDIQDESFKGPLVYDNSVTGYRFWYLKGNGKVRSKAWSAHDWIPGENLAVCGRGEDHEAPDPQCHCGFFAMVKRPEREELWEMRRKDDPGLIFGMVRGHGTVVPGTKGWRSQKANILALYFDPMQVFLRWDLRTGTSRFMNNAVRYYGVPGFSEWKDFVSFAKENEEPYDSPAVSP